MPTPLNPRQRPYLTQKQNNTNKRSRRQSSPNRLRINFREGRFDIPGVDAWYGHWKEPYYLLLTIPWSGFLVLMALSYVVINTIFAIAYLMGGNCIENAIPGSFGDAFFFSVQTLASIGYGAMYPTTTYANMLVTTEALIGTMGIALMTGLAFTKFSQPTARVEFSNVATISDHNGTPTLMLRAANQRRNQIIKAEIKIYLMRDEISAEGEYMRRLYFLKPLRDQTPRFTLSWTIMHQIDESSPLWGTTSESLAQTKTMLIVSLSGIDETVAQPIHAPYSYAANDILWGHRFTEIFHQSPEGHYFIDFDHFHNTEPLE